MLKCKHCGKEHAEGVKFCPDCGRPVDQKAAHDLEMAEARNEAAKAERERVAGIVSRCQKHGLPVEFQQKLIDEGTPTDAAITKILDEIEKKNPTTPVQPNATVQKDEADKFRMHACNTIQVSLGLNKDKAVVEDVRKNPGPRDLHGLIRSCLIQDGEAAGAVMSLNADQLASKAIKMAGSAMGSSDLPYILADTMNKAFLGGMNEAPTTFDKWVKETENPDFRSKSMVKLSSFGDIDDLPEGMPFKAGKFSDKKESISVSTKGKKLNCTRQMLVNNDTGAISEFPRLMGVALKRRQNKDAYDLLAYNSLVGPTMTEDSQALFSATYHSNIVANSSIVSITSLGVAEGKLMEMPILKATADQSAVYSGAIAKYLITGTANRIPILQILGSKSDPSGANMDKPNPYFGDYITPIFDAYLQSLLTAASKANAWYLAADQNQMGSLVIAYLSGARTPTMRSEPSSVGQALGIEWDIFYDWGFAFEDYRGIIYNDGVTAG